MQVISMALVHEIKLLCKGIFMLVHSHWQSYRLSSYTNTFAMMVVTEA